MENFEKNGLRNKEMDLERKAKEELEKRFSGKIIDGDKKNILNGLSYQDLLSAIDELKSLRDDKEKRDTSLFVAFLASLALKKYVQHFIFTDRSARLLGTFLHEVFSKLDTDNHELTKNRIFFINPKNPRNGHDEKNDRKIANRITEGNSYIFSKSNTSQKGVSNIIIDEFIASEESAKTVLDYINKISKDYKKDKDKHIDNYIQPFYEAHSGDKEPSWFDNKKTSGVKKINNEIKPDPNKTAREIRDELKNASSYVANIAKDISKNDF